MNEHDSVVFRCRLHAEKSGRGLRARGIDVLTASEAELTDKTDDEQLVYAGSRGRVLVRHNISDFSRIHSQLQSRGDSHAGIILIPQQRYSVRERIRLLLKLIAGRSAEDMTNRLEFLSNWR